MSDTSVIPVALTVRNLFEDLLGRDVNVSPGDPMTAADLPTAAVREQVIQAAFHRGLLLLGCGETALRFCPPLCVTAGQVETCLRILGEVLAGVGRQPPADRTEQGADAPHSPAAV